MGYKHLKFPEGSLFLVTGGAGFIGSNLCEAILSLGYRVRCLDDLSTGKEEHVKMFSDNPNYEFVKGDIKDLDTCMKACQGVDYVLNQAAWGSVPRSIEMPLFYCANNISGTLNMLEAARQNGVKNAEFICSKAEDCTFPSPDVLLIDPPRKGCAPSLIEYIGKLLPKKIVYISCSPDTLARDCVEFVKMGYKMSEVQPFNMFQRTEHVENVVCLTLK